MRMSMGTHVKRIMGKRIEKPKIGGNYFTRFQFEKMSSDSLFLRLIVNYNK